MTIRWICPSESSKREPIGMRYIHVKWIHSFPNDPVELYSEIDEAGYETRKVEVFPDCSIGFADSTQHMLSTELGEKPIPSLEQLALDPQFLPAPISKEEFEKIWAKRYSSISQER
jgi:hypothetical protein